MIISTNLQAKYDRENVSPSKLANVMSFGLLAGLAILYGSTTALYLIHKGVLS